ncbi:LysM peptidoglycan-binding domain-containing protein [Sporosarcina highlanderae]|uniref:LysM peptidoglycan-binding domain-containing protein n=1 Tax=Sporosarcina highlanderae TaxID=3035916 RepID=A0ABT8JX85_9BACL|nr:LysM peptidoglycan-binding domain-containing protein [Sporosarcina highlanderae]MDN4608759.1 LysM peptidoglycan-binding domain-containing protein [Sporosarcina highlanderae]
MKNDDYKVEFENNRKEIELDQPEITRLPSRAERYGRQRKQKKTSRYTMINVILGVFTFIPILIFVYVIYNYYYGTDSGSAKVGNTEFSVEVDTNSSSGKTDDSASVVLDIQKEDEDENASEGNAEQEPEEESDSKKPVVNVNPSATEKKDSTVVSEKPKNEGKPTEQTLSKTHIVAENETLYRISMNYYGSNAGIEKIMKANGLTSNDIMAGQKLIIP